MKMETPRPNSPGHEITPWRAKPFVIGIVSFFIFMGLIFVILRWLTVSWTHHRWPKEILINAPQTDPRWNDHVPQLQVNAQMDLIHLRQVEYENLHTVRWTDPAHTYAAIPIQRAMIMLVQATANHRVNQLLPEPKPASPIDLQNQKSSAVAPMEKSP